MIHLYTELDADDRRQPIAVIRVFLAKWGCQLSSFSYRLAIWYPCRMLPICPLQVGYMPVKRYTAQQAQAQCRSLLEQGDPGRLAVRSRHELMNPVGNTGDRHTGNRL